MTDSSSSEIFSSPLANSGDGDGIKNVTTRKRTPVPSSRKFNVRKPCDQNMKLKLEQALTDIQKPKKHTCLTKAQSIAEITPSKTKPKKKSQFKLELVGDADDHDTLPLNVALHATPRPLDGTLATSAQASRRCTRDWAVCTVYGRLLLCVWRRYKARLQTLSESSGRQLNQISQLELQVDFLKSMRQSECDKRNEALHDYQLMKKKVDVMELANNNLMQDLKDIQEELVNTKKNLKLTKHDLKKRCDQTMDLMAQIASQEQEILTQNTIILNLQEKQTTTEMNLHNIESSFKIKQEELNEVKQKVEMEVNQNILLKDQISNLQMTKLELQQRAEHLEEELEWYISNNEEMKDENISIKEELKEANLKLSTEKNKKWIKITKELSLLSLSALQKIAEVVLQVYHKY